MFPIKFNVTQEMVIAAFKNKISYTDLIDIFKIVGDHYDWGVKMELASALVEEVQQDHLSKYFTDEDIPDNLKPLLLIEAQKDFNKKLETENPDDYTSFETKEAVKWIKENPILSYNNLLYAFCAGYETSELSISQNTQKDILEEILEKLKDYEDTSNI